MPQLAGFYYDDAGAAVSGATVNVYARNTTTPVITTTTTDSSGYWQRTGIAEGRYDVEIVDGSIKRRIKYDDEIQVERIEAAVLQLRNPAETFVYDIVPGAITANRTLNVPLLTATDTLAVLALAQTFLTGVKTFNDAILAVRNPADTFSYSIRSSAITANRDLTLPLITGTDTLSVLGLAQTYSAVKTFSAIPVMSGGAVGFPGTQVASATANDLDDYEEGTFTPGLTFGGAAVGMTFTTQTGRYTKVGRLVSFEIRIDLSAKGSSTGSALITGLPFTVSAVASAISIGYLSAISFANFPEGGIDPSATTISLRETTDAGVITDLVETNFADASIIILSGSYQV